MSHDDRSLPLVIGLIPARGGSKGVPRKNMKQVMGRPLIDFSILAALRSKRISRVFVSSDDPDILRHAHSMGSACIVRPDEYSTDTATAVEVVEHFVSTLSDKLVEQNPYIVYLQPTSPFRTSQHIDDALDQMWAYGADSLVSVSESQKSPFKMFVVNSKGSLQSLFDETLSNTRRQDLPSAFSPNGAIYAFRVSEFRARRGFPFNGSMPFVMNDSESLDIDSEDDFRRAEMILGDK